jgi:hypothetical protein
MNNSAQLPNAKNPIRTSLANALTDLQSVVLIAERQFAKAKAARRFAPRRLD